jgi:hypothetical protein
MQLVITLTLVAVFNERFGVDLAFLADTGLFLRSGGAVPTREDMVAYRSTFIFNVFVFSQIFNEFNARSLGDDWNVWRGLHRNRIFIVIIFISMGMQAIMVELCGEFCTTTGLTGQHWLYSILLGALAIPVGVLMRFVPVPARASDYANFYIAYFNAAMDKRSGGKLPAAAQTASLEDGEGGGAPHSPSHRGLRITSKAALGGTGAPSPVLAPPFSPTTSLANVTGIHTGYSPKMGPAGNDAGFAPLPAQQRGGAGGGSAHLVLASPVTPSDVSAGGNLGDSRSPAPLLPQEQPAL